MSELLSQEEVNALLQSVSDIDDFDESDGVPTSDVAPVAVSEPTQNTTPATPYDFTRSNQIPQSALERLHNVFVRYAECLSTSASAHLRTECKVALQGIEQASYGEFVEQLPPSTYINVVSSASQNAQLALEISPKLVFTLIERLMGGNSKPLSKHREVTALEQRLVEGFLKVALGDLSAMWQTVAPADFTLERREPNPLLMRIAPTQESVAVVSLEVTAGHAAGSIRFCIPSAQLLPFEAGLPQAADNAGTSAENVSPEELARLDSVLGSARVTVSADICKLSMKIGKLLELEAGATLPLGLTSGDPVTVNVSGVTLYTATHGARKEHKAVRVIDTIENTDATRELETAPFTPAGALG